jgi:hypothetical protein
MDPKSEAQQAADAHQIQSLIYKYCRALDRCDGDLLKSIYWPDAIHNHTVFNGNAYDFADYAIPAMKKYFLKTLHCISNILIEFRGDVATSECYCTAYHRISNDAQIVKEVFGDDYFRKVEKTNADSHDFIYLGRYVDRFERRQGAWRIASRLVVQEWTINQPSTAIWAPSLANSVKASGSRDLEDPSYVLSASRAM